MSDIRRPLAATCAALSLALALALAAPASAEDAPLGFVTGAANPEDLVALDGTQWVVVSAMRSKDRKGSLMAVDTRAPAAAVPLYSGPAAFAPHGIAARARGGGQFELLVVDHGTGEAIARMVIEVGDHRPPRVVGVARVRLPTGVSANGVAPLPDGGFAVTSMFDPRDPGHVDKLAARAPTGAIWRWSPGAGWREIVRPRLSGANGIAVSPDGKTLFASEWAARRIWRIPLDGGEPRSAPTAFLPDNLRWMRDGGLLVAGQTASPRGLFGCQDGKARCPMGFTVAVVDPATLAVRPLVGGDAASFAATGFGGATGAIQVGDEIWVGSFTGDRVARFRGSVHPWGSTASRRPKIWRRVTQPLMPPRLLPIW
jgi:hypothetical protein